MKPTIENIGNPGKAFKWTLFHIALGAVTTVVPQLFILYFYMVMLFNLPAASAAVRKGNMEPFVLFLTYLLGFELMGRITSSSPFIPYEYAKYFSILFGVYLIAISPRKIQKTGVWLLLLLLPGLFYDRSGMRLWEDIVANVLGPIGLALFVSVFGSYLPSQKLIVKSLRLMWLPLVAILVNMYLKTPELDSINVQLRSSRAATGGATSNQASTILGLGMFLSFYSLYTGQSFSGKRLLDGLLLMLFAFQGLLTFSRGGMLVGLLAIILVALTTEPSRDNGKAKKARKANLSYLYLLVGAIFLLGSFLIVDNATGGKLTMRYKGETNATVSGNMEKDFSKISSGRSDIVGEDLAIFLDYPAFGSGAGSSGYMRMLRTQSEFLIPHVEFSRLLAEHGILGLANFLLLVFIGWKSWKARRLVNSGNLLFILFLIGFLSSFHSSTRTAVTPLLISLSAMSLRADQIRKRV